MRACAPGIVGRARAATGQDGQQGAAPATNGRPARCGRTGTQRTAAARPCPFFLCPPLREEGTVGRGLAGRHACVSAAPRLRVEPSLPTQVTVQGCHAGERARSPTAFCVPGPRRPVPSCCCPLTPLQPPAPFPSACADRPIDPSTRQPTNHAPLSCARTARAPPLTARVHIPPGRCCETPLRRPRLRLRLRLRRSVRARVPAACPPRLRHPSARTVVRIIRPAGRQGTQHRWRRRAARAG